jgi:hypothetical protein
MILPFLRRRKDRALDLEIAERDRDLECARLLEQRAAIVLLEMDLDRKRAGLIEDSARRDDEDYFEW